jgi:hypothetical protein
MAKHVIFLVAGASAASGWRGQISRHSSGEARNLWQSVRVLGMYVKKLGYCADDFNGKMLYVGELHRTVRLTAKDAKPDGSFLLCYFWGILGATPKPGQTGEISNELYLSQGQVDALQKPLRELGKECDWVLSRDRKG